LPWAPLISDPDFGVSQASLEEVLPRFVELYGDTLPGRPMDWLMSARSDPEPLMREPELPIAVLHGDFRLDNLLFADDAAIALDWQATALGSPLYDLACFLGGSLSVEHRRAHEEAILDAYAEGLRHAGWEVPRPVLWRAYRRAHLVSMLVTTVHVGKAKPPTDAARAQLREVLLRVFVAADDLDAKEATVSHASDR
jgi:aminoglycoside phosphotransferase (APT) family kinase protein